MPTKFNQTTITLADDLKQQLYTYKDPGESWDHLIRELLMIVEERAKEKNEGRNLL